MQKILLVFILLLETLCSAQSISTSNNTDTTNCNGYVELSDTAGLDSWCWVNDNSDTLLNNGGLLQGLCEGTYFLYTTDTLAVDSTITFLIENDLPLDCNGLNVEFANSYPYSVDGDCAGYLEAYPAGGTPPYSYSWSNQNTIALNDGLCAGSYTVTVIDMNACETTASGMVYDSTSTQSTDTSFVINVNTNNVSADGECDGNMQTSIFGGTAPYGFVHSGGETTANLANLCAGFYSVTVIDSNGDSLSYSYLISSPETYYDNDTYVDSVVVDSVSSLLSEDCDINYQNVDSVYIGSLGFPSMDLVVVNWIVFYNGTQSTVVTESYYLQSGNGTYVLELSLYCPNKATDNFLKATDQIYYSTNLVGSSGVNGLSESNDVNVNIYPNPFNEQITIQLSENGSYNIEIYDISGRLLLSEKYNSSSIILNVNELNVGQYLVKIQEDDNILIRKIIK